MQVFWNQKASHITIDLPLMIDAAFCAGSGMIAFGAVIGKTTPTQLIWLMIAQVGACMGRARRGEERGARRGEEGVPGLYTHRMTTTITGVGSYIVVLYMKL